MQKRTPSPMTTVTTTRGTLVPLRSGRKKNPVAVQGRGRRGAGSSAKPLDRCRAGLLDKLRALCCSGVLHQSLQPGNPASNFELLEFYGDSVLSERISAFLMQTRRFMSPHLLTMLRCAVVNNKNLARCYDTLCLGSLLMGDEHMPSMTKDKADIVEAIIGELAEACNRHDSSDSRHAKSVLDEFLAYICYSGEEAYFIAMDLPSVSALAIEKATESALDQKLKTKATTIAIHKQSSPSSSSFTRTVSEIWLADPTAAPALRT